MEKSAETISERKFVGLSARQQHRILAQWADICLESHDINRFLSHYQRLQKLVELDVYRPPSWQADDEKLADFSAFHRLQAGLPQISSAPLQIGWQPSYPIEVIADQVRSPHNMGSFVRLIDNFGMERLIYGASWFSPDHAQFKRTARGAENWVPLIHEPDLLAYLEASERECIALELDDESNSIFDWKPTGPVSVLLGNEESGLAKNLKERCQTVLSIPMSGHKRSMNVSSALSVFAFHAVSWFDRQFCDNASNKEPGKKEAT